MGSKGQAALNAVWFLRRWATKSSLQDHHCPCGWCRDALNYLRSGASTVDQVQCENAGFCSVAEEEIAAARLRSDIVAQAGDASSNIIHIEKFSLGGVRRRARQKCRRCNNRESLLRNIIQNRLGILEPAPAWID
jgi:hypothetical protein